MRADEIFPPKTLEESKKYTVKEYIEIALRNAKAKARYKFNRGYLLFHDIMSDPRSALETYRKESKRETSRLAEILTHMKPEPRFTDKEHYFRIGFESRGYCGNNVAMIWIKDKTGQSLIICADSNTEIMEIRDFFKFFKIIE